MSALAVDGGVEPYVAGDTSSVADSTTLTSWAKPEGNSLADSSRDTGRIWTDKSVSKENVTLTGDVGRVTINKTEGADFLVGLSALSSASSLATTTSKPLDIVLVLDVSGSMKENLNSYEEVYQLDREENYYVLVDGEYRRVRYSDGGYGQQRGWYYGDYYRTYVTPMTSAEDNSPDHTQFFTRTSMSKMAALKAAATAFVNQVGTNNDAIQDENNKHRVAVVKYSYTNDTETAVGLTSNIALVNQEINNLRAGGSTAADTGLEHAEDELTENARSNAQKVVIFFTDGEPNHGSGFDQDVAADAINEAKGLKDIGATIYSIGVFSSANPDANLENTSLSEYNDNRFNLYMHAVSSNYPEATASDPDWWGNYSVTLGNRAADKQYYFAATDAQGLNDVFNAISEDMQQAASPTEVTNNDPQHSGYITFTDTLGEYMEVKGVNAVVYAGKQYNEISTNDNGATYTVTGKVSGNEIYKEADLSDIKITVDKNGTGDTIKVEIPASLIPLRYYDIKTENGQTSMTIKGNAYPIRVFYSVGLKDGVKDQVKSGNYSDPTLQTYVNEHKDAAGKAYFYSNAYTSGSNGTTTAEFTPAETNSFYYFTEDTPLYTDRGQTRAQRIDANATYYYPIYYYNAGSNVSEQTYWVEVPGSYLANAQVTESNSEGVYIKKDVRRTTRAQAFALPKEEGANETSTASNAISPSWERGNG